MATAVFIHGMNSYNDDLFHIGPLRYGFMHEVWQREAKKRGIPFIGITGLGAASPEDQVQAILRCFEQHGVLENSSESFHLIGQSIGGIAARLLAYHPKMRGRIQSIVTMGTPHQGTFVAELGVEFRDRYPWGGWLLKHAGYDTRPRESIYQHYTPKALEEFNRHYPALEGVPETCMLCDVPYQQISFLLWPLYFLLHPRDEQGQRPKSDGFISIESQKRGRVLGPFAVDHVAQFGIFFYFTPRLRRQAEQEFHRLVDATFALFS